MPTAKRQRTEEEDREWVSRLGGRGQRNREWFEEERKKGQRVVVDLGFDQLMTEREVKSLVTQIAHVSGSGAHMRTRLQTQSDTRARACTHTHTHTRTHTHTPPARPPLANTVS